MHQLLYLQVCLQLQTNTSRDDVLCWVAGLPAFSYQYQQRQPTSSASVLGMVCHFQVANHNYEWFPKWQTNVKHDYKLQFFVLWAFGGMRTLDG